MAKMSIPEKKAALQAELAKLEAREKQEQEAKYALIGRAVSDAMESDAELKQRVEAILSENVKSNPDRQLLGLAKIPSKRGRPSKAYADATE